MVTQQDFVPDQHKVTAKFGPFLIGVFINMILYGVLLMQVLTYFQTFKKDRWAIKALIHYLFVIETVNTGLCMYIIYEPLVLKYGTEISGACFPTVLASEPIIIGLVGTPVQFFIAYRIRVITQSVFIPAAICFLSLVSMAGSFWTGAVLVTKVAMFQDQARLRNAVLLWLLTAAVSDILLTGTLVRALYEKKKGAFKPMDTVLNRIILLTVQTGMITALAAVLDVIFFVAVPHTSINFTFGLALTKLYANCILSTLNARSGWNSALNTGQNEPNFLWDSDGVTGKESGSTSQTATNGILVFANPTATSNIESGLGLSSLSHRPRTYDLEMDLISSRERHDSTQPFISEDDCNISVDKVARTLEDPLLQKPRPAAEGDVRSRDKRHYYQRSV